MGNHTSNTAKIQQNFMNNVTQSNQQDCIATVNSQANNNVVIVSGSKIDGNFTGVAATTSTDATCLISSSMNSQVENSLSAQLQQENKTETDLFNDFSFNSETNTFNIDQSVTNNISQINQAVCSSNNTTSTSDNYVYVSDSTVGGNFVGVTNNATASADCTMQNYMKNVTYNQAQASATQSNSIEGMWATLLGAIVSIITIIVIAVIIIFSIGAIGYVGFKKYDKPSTGEEQTGNDLGLPPDVLAALGNGGSGDVNLGEANLNVEQ